MKTHKTDSPLLSVCEEEVPPEQQERSPSLGQEEPEPLQIKKEQEELWTSQEGEQLQGLEEADIIKFTFNPFSEKCEHVGENTESSQFSQTTDPAFLHIKAEQEELFQDLVEADIIKFTFNPVPVKSEHDEEKPQSSWFNQTKTEENREAEPLASTSTEQMKTEPDGEYCGVSEPASNLDPAGDLEPTRVGQPLSSDCYVSETDDSDEWEETGEPQSGLNTLKSKKTQKNKGQNLSNSDKFKSSVGLSHEVTFSNQILFEPLSCKMCGKCFPWRSSLMAHVRVHSSDCGLCGKHLEPTESLKLHLETHRTCTVCGKKFTTSTNLDNHMRKHTGEKPYSCTLCHKRFGQKGNLKAHLRGHTGEKPFSCTQCLERFRQKSYLNRHMRTHTGGKPYSCTVCNKRFGQKGEMERHMRSHTGERPYSCTVCHKSFASNQNLNHHLKSHTEEKRAQTEEPSLWFGYLNG